MSYRSPSKCDSGSRSSRWRGARIFVLVGCALATSLAGCESDGDTIIVEDAGADAGPLPACTDGVPAVADRAPGKLTVMVATTEVSALAADERELFVSAVIDGNHGTYAFPKQGGAMRAVSTRRLSQLESDGQWLYGEGLRIDKVTGTSIVYQDGVTHVGHDAEAVYLLFPDGDLVRKTKDGSGEATIVASNVSPGARIRNGYAYWTGRGELDSRAETAIVRVPTRGGIVEKLAIRSLASQFAVDCNYVYLTGFGSASSVPSVSGVARMRLGGGPAVPFAEVAGGELFVDAVSLYSVSSAEIQRVSLATGAVTVVKGPYERRLFAMGDDAVYWSGPEGVVRAPK